MKKMIAAQVAWLAVKGLYQLVPAIKTKLEKMLEEAEKKEKEANEERH